MSRTVYYVRGLSLNNLLTYDVDKKKKIYIVDIYISEIFLHTSLKIKRKTIEKLNIFEHTETKELRNK